MPKANAYSLFVKDEFEKRVKTNRSLKMPSLFRELDAPWRNASPQVKEYYKQLAKGNKISKPQCLREGYHDGGENNDATDLNDLSDLMNLSASNSTEQPNDAQFKTEDEEISSKQSTSHAKPPQTDNKPPNYSKTQSSYEEDYEEAEHVRLHTSCERLVQEKSFHDLLEKPVYSISVNVLCDQEFQDNGKAVELYLPLEIAIVAYTIMEGHIVDPYHIMIDCGELPNGKLADAVAHQENHKIPFKPKNPKFAPGARKDYKTIYKEMLEYVGVEKVILIWSVDYMEQIKGSLEWLYRQACQDDSLLPKVSTWTILPVANYISCIEDRITVELENIEAPIFGIYYVELKLEDEEENSYNDAYKCKFHMGAENETKWCALSRAYKVFSTLVDGFDHLAKVWKYHKEKQLKSGTQTMADGEICLENTNGSQRANQSSSIRGGEERRLKPNEFASAGVVYEEPPDVF